MNQLIMLALGLPPPTPLGRDLAGQWWKGILPLSRASSRALDGSLCMRKKGPKISMDLWVDWMEQDWKHLEKRHKRSSWEWVQSLRVFGPHWCWGSLEHPGRECLLWWVPACSVLGHPRACVTDLCTGCHGCRGGGDVWPCSTGFLSPRLTWLLLLRI